MIPITLRISGFLSYKEPVELDFSSFHLACISGFNGAGKSSILDAITWSLFGMARKRDDSVIHTNPEVKMAEVVFTFQYEEQVYRVIRTLPRGKGTNLEFQIQAMQKDGLEPIWRSISEHSVRETQDRIQKVLSLDYETFVNAAFFLQGKADQFAQQTSGKRKEILGNILGLEVWESYREKTSERRKIVENDLALKDGLIRDIDEELSEEPARKQRLKELEKSLGQVSETRKTQELNLDQMKKTAASLEQQRKLVNSLKENLDRTVHTGINLMERRNSRQEELEKNSILVKRAGEIEKSYKQWNSCRDKLEELDILEKKYREIEKQTDPLVNQINNEKKRLENEISTLKVEKDNITKIKESLPGLRDDIQKKKTNLDLIETRLNEKEEINKEILSLREKQGELKSTLENLKNKSLELKERSDKLEKAEGVDCPLCGQPLNSGDKERLVKQLDHQVSTNRDDYKEIKFRLEKTGAHVVELEKDMDQFRNLENERLTISNQLTRLEENYQSHERNIQDWEMKEGHYKSLSLQFEQELFLPEERKSLKEFSDQLVEIGYDVNIYEEFKTNEMELRHYQNEYLELTIAKGSIKPIQDEIQNLDEQIAANSIEIELQARKHHDALELLEAVESTQPDLESNVSTLNSLREEENQLISEVGGAKQRVSVLKDQKRKKTSLTSEREELALLIGRLKTLERAFGKDGVPALLIEQALPELESRANDLLERLSDGSMSVNFLTQADYKDKKRKDRKETLDIQIRDGSGVRDYEMFSGGEAFRVNFAIRLALSEVLSHRKGARLQTLVIDEGFGSQDGQGRQRLIESINAVKEDFAKVLIITHLEELKDAFQTRIEVTKTENGSQILVT